VNPNFAIASAAAPTLEASRAQAARFAATTTDDRPFLQQYVDLIRSADSDPNLSQWVLDNYKCMKDSMFFDDGGWEKYLLPQDIIRLRVYAPEKVFNETAKSGYLMHTGSNSSLATIADAIFAPTDIAFINGLPDEEKAGALVLVKFAYAKHIRRQDPAVMQII